MIWGFKDPNFKNDLGVACPRTHQGLCRHVCKLDPATSSVPNGLVLLNWATCSPDDRSHFDSIYSWEKGIR